MTRSEPATDQGHTALEDRLTDRFARQATALAPEPVPLNAILARSRRRRTRHHALGVAAGVGALVVTSGVVVRHARDDIGVTTDTPFAADPTGGSGGSAGAGGPGGPAAVNDVPASFGADGSTDGWSADAPRVVVELPGAQLIEVKQTPWGHGPEPLTAGDQIHQRFRADPEDFSSASLELQSLPVDAATLPPVGDQGARAVTIAGHEGRVRSGGGSATTDVYWLTDHRWVGLEGQGVTSDEVVDIANRIVEQPDGSFTFPTRPLGMVEVVPAEHPHATPSTSELHYRIGSGLVVLRTLEDGRAGLENVADLGVAGPYEYRSVLGHRAVISTPVITDSDPIRGFSTRPSGTIAPLTSLSIGYFMVTWYDPAHDAVVSISVQDVPGGLDAVLAHVVELDAPAYQAHLARTADPSVTTAPSTTVPDQASTPTSADSSPPLPSTVVTTTAPRPGAGSAAGVGSTTTAPGPPPGPADFTESTTTAPGPGATGAGATVTTSPAPSTTFPPSMGPSPG